jgi:hypothetical protein
VPDLAKCGHRCSLFGNLLSNLKVQGIYPAMDAKTVPVAAIHFAVPFFFCQYVLF